MKDLIQKAVKVRKKYGELEMKKYGKQRTTSQVAQGFVGDVGDLMKLVMAKDGIKEIDNMDKKLEHELADCLYSIFVLADKYNIDLEKSFLSTINELTERISKGKE